VDARGVPGDSLGYARRYLEDPSTAVLVGSTDVRALVTAVSTAAGGSAPLLIMPSTNSTEDVVGLLDVASGTIDTAYLVGSIPAGLDEKALRAISGA
jgi:hypothetical protein